MGYIKIVKYGDITEIYEYEKNLVHHTKRNVSPIAKKRAKEIRKLSQSQGLYQRSQKSIRRSQFNFFRLCHHNSCLATSIHFLTLTFAYDLTFKTASRYVARFMEKLKKDCGEISVSYISVPELTKNGRFHFHLLVFNLSTETAGFPISIRRYNKRRRKWEMVHSTSERITRNLQRLFERGYLDICPTTYNSAGIAGYMAKYMGKALGDFKNENKRGFACSRNIEKISIAGSNSFYEYKGIMADFDGDTLHEGHYDVPFLGRCYHKKIKNNYANS